MKHTKTAIEHSTPQERPLLVVEDNEINIKVISIILDKNGFKFVIAKNGEEAINTYQNGTYSAILMDCQMPVKDGLQASRDIRSYESSLGKPRCPIIALTANAMSGDKDRCLSAGMDDFISKPFKGSDLVQIINKWCIEKNGAVQ